MVDGKGTTTSWIDAGLDFNFSSLLAWDRELGQDEMGWDLGRYRDFKEGCDYDDKVERSENAQPRAAIGPRAILWDSGRCLAKAQVGRGAKATCRASRSISPHLPRVKVDIPQPGTQHPKRHVPNPHVQPASLSWRIPTEQRSSK